MTDVSETAARRPRRPFSADDAAIIAAMLADGEPFQDIGRRLGRWPHSVARWAYARGLAVKLPRRPPRHYTDMVALYQRRVPVYAILAQYHCSPTVFYRALRSAGVPLHYPGKSTARRGKREAPCPTE